MHMMWPVTDANFETESFKQFGEKRFLTTPLMKWMWDLYTTDPKERKQIYASPLQATVEQLKGLPPALIQVAESDILRDEGEAYGRKLDEAGVKVTTVRYDGMFGENFTTVGLLESQLNIGDKFHVGSATVTVTEPRMRKTSQMMIWKSFTLNAEPKYAPKILRI